VIWGEAPKRHLKLGFNGKKWILKEKQTNASGGRDVRLAMSSQNFPEQKGNSKIMPGFF